MTTPSPHALIGRSLRAIASPEGVVCVLALDHRDAMRNAFKRAGIADVSEAAMLDVKSRIVEALATSASGIMLDPPAVARCRPPGIGLIVPLEAQGHQPLDGGRLNQLSEAFGPADAAVLGADGCKLLLYYRADHPETALRQRALVESVAADCHQHGLPLIVEPIVHRLEDEDVATHARLFGKLVVAAARELADSGADLLKLQFPGSAALCERVTAAAAPLDWVVLGGSDVACDTFADQLQTACRAGAAGFMAGRAIWSDALGRPEHEQAAWLRNEARPLFDHLTDIAQTYERRTR
jgi:tagatose-1,6-bisphosphate aldolase